MTDVSYNPCSYNPCSDVYNLRAVLTTMPHTGWDAPTRSKMFLVIALPLLTLHPTADVACKALAEQIVDGSSSPSPWIPGHALLSDAVATLRRIEPEIFRDLDAPALLGI